MKGSRIRFFLFLGLALCIVAVGVFAPAIATHDPQEAAFWGVEPIRMAALVD